MKDLPDATYVFITSLVSSRDMGPRVQIEIGECKTQVNAAKAHEIAMMILDASEAAMSDAMLVKFLVEKTGAPVNNIIGTILIDFRAFRDEQERKRDE